MRPPQNILTLVARLAADYWTSAVELLKSTEPELTPANFCIFVGYPRSGHSLVGALLDAHPNMVIAHELDVLKYVYMRFSRRQLFWLLERRSAEFAKSHRQKGGYNYQMPNQWQGRYRHLAVLGDKKGEGATLRLRGWPWLLGRLRQTVKVPVKIIHVYRNPYDNISTLFRKTQRFKPQVDLRECIEHYFLLCNTVNAIKRQTPDIDWLDLQHEALIQTPGKYLQSLCEFLQVSAPDDWVADCSDILFEKPHQSRFEINWPNELIDLCQIYINQQVHLRDYAYHL